MKRLVTDKRLRILLAAVVILAVVIVAVAGTLLSSSHKKGAEILSTSSLQKIVDIGELSTFTAVYNGVAEVYDEEDPGKIEYYVSYEADVKAGFDFEKLKTSVNEEEKRIYITIPDVYITDIFVDITSMDFIFVDQKANTSTVSEEAFRACEADVLDESEKQSAIVELARKNAVNVLTALIEPIIEQTQGEYQITIGEESV